MSNLPHAIVVGVDSMQGIQTVRLLARRGIPVIGITRSLKHHCARTRLCERILEANTQNDEFIDTLLTLGPELPQKAVLFPCHDMTVARLASRPPELDNWFHTVLPDTDTVDLLMNKVRFYRYAQGAGWPIPSTFLLENRRDAESAVQSINYPAVLKPPVITPQWTRHSEQKVYSVDSPEEALAAYDRCTEWSALLILQEWVPGEDSQLISCNCYIDASGQPLASFVARKIRQWPPEAGFSSFGQECRNDEVLATTHAVLRSTAYHGLGYVEFKHDERTGIHYILDVNIGRPTGRSAIAEAGGVELLKTMYCDALGRALPVERKQTYGNAKWVDLRHDLQSALHYWRRGDLTIADWWRSWRGPKAHTLISASDPAPFLFDLAAAIRKAFSAKARDRHAYANRGGAAGKTAAHTPSH